MPEKKKKPRSKFFRKNSATNTNSKKIVSSKLPGRRSGYDRDDRARINNNSDYQQDFDRRNHQRKAEYNDTPGYRIRRNNL